MGSTGKSLLIYGAYGYSGRLIAAAALRRGLAPIVAGRDEAKVAALGRELGLAHRAFRIDAAATAAAGLDGVGVVVHCAGPFATTAKPMVDACLARGAHYLDINGEWPVMEALAARDAEFAAAGLMLMPSVGADVVPTDCLALHVKQRLPEATRLELFVHMFNVPSRGTANTFVEALGKPNLVREAGVLREKPSGAGRRRVEIEGKWVAMVGLPWGDISSAWRSTGIPNIEVYLSLTPGSRPFLAFAGRTRAFWQSRPVQRTLKRLVQRLPEGPDAEARARGRADFIAVAIDAGGRTVRSHLRTPEGYALTAETASEIARRVLGGEWQAGHRTPAMVFGADFILEFAGAERRDL